jgi:hypothetical protein
VLKRRKEGVQLTSRRPAPARGRSDELLRGSMRARGIGQAVELQGGGGSMGGTERKQRGRT